MRVRIFEERYRKLEKQVKKWRKYKKRANWITYSIFIAVFIWLAFAIVKDYPSFDFLTSNWWMYSSELVIGIVLVYVYLVVAALASYRVRKKGLVYRPNADNLALYYVCNILENLEDYHKNKRPTLKEEYKRRAVESAKELLSTATEDWTLGDFGLAKKVYGDAISDILDNLSKRVIPNLERDDEDTMKKVEHSLYQFAQYLLRPSLERLQHVNKSMSNDLDSYETMKGFRARFSSFLETYTILKHISMVVLILAFSFLLALLGIQYWNISTDTAFIGFATIFSALIAGYLVYALKKK